MIIPPAPAARPGKARRAIRATGLAVPVALLLVVVAAGLLGPRPESSPDAPSPAAVAPPSSAPERRERPAWVPAAEPDFPDTVAGLPVRSVPDARVRLDVDGERPVAVAGWLGELRPPDACDLVSGDPRGVLSPLCLRHARLVVADPATPDGSAHLHLTIPPGIALPQALERRGTAEDAALAVVVVGRGSPPGAACVQSARGCTEQLTIDWLAWADGGAFEPGPVPDTGLLATPPGIAYRRRDAAVRLATQGSGVELVEALLRPATVAAVDVEAGDALARLPPPEGLVWYARSMNVAAGGDPLDPDARIRWALLDDTTGRRLATGVSGDPGRTSLAPVAPSDVAGLPVRDVAAVLADEEAGVGHGVEAVTGYLLAWTDPRACTLPIPGLQAVGCSRHAVLAAASWPTDQPGATEPPVEHLLATVPPGVVVPESALQIDGADGLPTEVVLVVRPSRPADCRGADCAPFVVEHVAWADGAWLVAGRQAATPLSVLDDRVGADPALAARRVIGPVDLLLRSVLVNRHQLRILDPDAARALRAAGERAGPVWYLRGLDLRSLGPARIRWAVAAAPTGRRIVVGEAPLEGS